MFSSSLAFSSLFSSPAMSSSSRFKSPHNQHLIISINQRHEYYNVGTSSTSNPPSQAFSGWLPEAAHRQLVSLGIATGGSTITWTLEANDRELFLLLGGMFAVCLLTSLGKDMLASCKSPSTPPPTSSSCPLSDLTDINPAAS